MDEKNEVLATKDSEIDTNIDATSLEEKEKELTAREARLLAKEKELAEKGYINYKEKMYDKINISVATLDKVIIGLVVVIVAVILLGIANGGGF